VEFITLARKPLSEPNVAANVTRWGTGGLNIGACRIGHNEACRPMAAQADSGKFFGQAGRHAPTLELKPEGRWPGNLILQTCGPTCGESCAPGCAVAEMDRQSGESRSSGREIRRSASLHDTENGWGMRHAEVAGAAYGDTGTASRFFACIEPDAPFQYVPKPSRSERDQGCGELPDQTRNRVNPGGLENDPRWAPVVAKNTHATVKPVNLLSYLCRLICPPGGTVLDPFAGSGSTGVACIREGFGFLGMELEREHCEIAEARLRDARSRYSREFGKRTPQPVRKRPTERTPQPSLFDLLEAE
jgi:site-specific DNA-methyltransferase (adenine-specific)